MMQIGKKALVEYFKSFFKQYGLSITEEQYGKIRDLVDEAECGCCALSTIYWVDNDDSNATPADYQIIFKDADDNVLSQTSVTGSSPQRVCIPREATQLCINVINEVTADSGEFGITGSDGFAFAEAETEGEHCETITFPFADVYIVTSVDGAP